MGLRWQKFVYSTVSTLSLSGRRAKRKNELRPIMAEDFAVRRWPQSDRSFNRTPGEARRPGVYLTWPDQQPFLRSWSEKFTIPRSEIPALTITADAGEISVSGAAWPDWSLRFLASGDGSSEAEAIDRSRLFSCARIGSTISVNGPRRERRREGEGYLEIAGPADAPMSVQTTFASVQVCDMSSPVWVSAIDAQVRILNTTGTVAASGCVVSFAGSEGDVTLSAEHSVNLKFTSVHFDGTMTARAQRSLRILVPRGFQTPFEAFVRRRKDFVCRTEFCGKVKHERRGTMHVFTYAGDGSVPAERVQLRSEHETVVIDDAVTGRQTDRVLHPGAFEDYE